MLNDSKNRAKLLHVRALVEEALELTRDEPEVVTRLRKALAATDAALAATTDGEHR